MARQQRPAVRLRVEALWRRLALLQQSQNWLAAEVGISRSYLSTLIRDGRAPSGRIRQRMQAALRVEDFHELFSLEGPDDNA